MLSGYIIAKNAGILGRSANLMIHILTIIAPLIARFLPKRVDMPLNFQLISWRKGVRYRFINLRRRIVLDWGMPQCQPFLRREIDIRLTFGDKIHIPRLGAYDRDGRYFEQTLIDGYSLLSRSDDTSRLFNTLQCIFRGSEQTLDDALERTIDGPTYHRQLCESVLSSPVLTDQCRSRIADLLSSVSILPEVFICRVHGDLNLGNVVVDSLDRTFLIDWERSSSMSLTHDYYNLLWFVQHVHGTKGLDLTPLNNEFFCRHLNLEAAAIAHAYEVLYFLERIRNWLEYPIKSRLWLDRLIDIMTLRMAQW